MNGPTHRLITEKAIIFLDEMAKPFTMNQKRISEFSTAIQQWNSDTDGKNFFENDIEFVDVEGGSGDAMDDPHSNQTWAIEDDPHYKDYGYPFTSFTHFIDIKKGAGIFDDYDGYSYHNGSACHDQHESMTDNIYDAKNPAAAWFIDLGTKVADVNEIDACIMGYWFNDEYVHIPGGKWYADCSPATWRYSYPNDTAKYPDKYAELKARFPTAKSTGSKGRGIPYSVFTPVDNLGRYWYERYLVSGDPNDLGPLLHAVQDATVPHHAAGYLGNYHAAYEDSLDAYANEICTNYISTFQSDVLKLFHQWNKKGATYKTLTYENDYSKVPNKNWNINQLITWAAFKAFHEFDQTYGGFKKNLFFQNSAYGLLTISCALSMLVLQKAKETIEQNQIPDQRKVTRITVKIANAIKNKYSGDFKILYFGDLNSNSGYYESTAFSPLLKKTLDSTFWEYNFDVEELNLDFDKLIIALNKVNKGEWRPKEVSVICRTKDSKVHYYNNSYLWNICVTNDCYQTIPRRRIFSDTKVGLIHLTHRTASARDAQTYGDLVFHAFSNEQMDWKLQHDFDTSNLKQGQLCTEIFDLSHFNMRLCDLRISVENKSNNGWLPAYFEIKIFSKPERTNEGAHLLFEQFIPWPRDKFFKCNSKDYSAEYELNLGYD